MHQEIPIDRLNKRRILQLMDMLQDVEIKEVLNKTQRKIVEVLERHEVVTEKQLIKLTGVSRPTILDNLKKLEKAKIVMSKRSSVRLIWINPAVKQWNELAKFNKKMLFDLTALLDKIDDFRLNNEGVKS